MELETAAIQTAQPAITHKKASETIQMVDDGKSLKIETFPSGTELLNVTCPAGKKWEVVISVRVNEENV